MELPLLGGFLAFGAVLLERGLAELLVVPAKQDVGAAACHVGGDGDGALAAGLGDDRGLALVFLGV